MITYQLPNMYISILRFTDKRWRAVAQLVETLSYSPEGRGFYSRWYHWNY